MSKISVPDVRFREMRRELGRIRRREQRKRHAGQVLNAIGYLIVIMAVAVILLSL
jgi:hypothetical protein